MAVLLQPQPLGQGFSRGAPGDPQSSFPLTFRVNQCRKAQVHPPLGGPSRFSYAANIHAPPPSPTYHPTKPLRTARSTCGPMTYLNDHRKLLFPHSTQNLFCTCGRPVPPNTPPCYYLQLATRA